MARSSIEDWGAKELIRLSRIAYLKPIHSALRRYGTSLGTSARDQQGRPSRDGERCRGAGSRMQHQHKRCLCSDSVTGELVQLRTSPIHRHAPWQADHSLSRSSGGEKRCGRAGHRVVRIRSGGGSGADHGAAVPRGRAATTTGRVGVAPPSARTDSNLVPRGRARRDAKLATPASRCPFRREMRLARPGRGVHHPRSGGSPE